VDDAVIAVVIALMGRGFDQPRSVVRLARSAAAGLLVEAPAAHSCPEGRVVAALNSRITGGGRPFWCSQLEKLRGSSPLSWKPPIRRLQPPLRADSPDSASRLQLTRWPAGQSSLGPSSLLAGPASRQRVPRRRACVRSDQPDFEQRA